MGVYLNRGLLGSQRIGDLGGTIGHRMRASTTSSTGIPATDKAAVYRPRALGPKAYGTRASPGRLIQGRAFLLQLTGQRCARTAAHDAGGAGGSMR
ncbi:hypothetical protein IF2G_10334 [Cordyceps javanica]|nr:hypothetical protein IF2G_10334 [Cordyceps javanica]